VILLSINDIREDKTGQLVLSHRKARTIKSWDRVISAETGEIVNGFVNAELKVV
jgi:small subunit ribosomal protein S1